MAKKRPGSRKKCPRSRKKRPDSRIKNVPDRKYTPWVAKNVPEQFFLGGLRIWDKWNGAFSKKEVKLKSTTTRRKQPIFKGEVWLKFTHFRHRLAPFSYEQFFGGVQDLDKWNGAFSKGEVNLKSTTTRLAIYLYIPPIYPLLRRFPAFPLINLK